MLKGHCHEMDIVQYNLLFTVYTVFLLTLYKQELSASIFDTFVQNYAQFVINK
jgi:hypothetical protein